MVLRGGRYAAAMGLCLIAALQGCNLKKVDVPGLSGPSELGTSLTITASPDVLFADDTSTSLIQVVVRNQNGQPFAGQGITFLITDGNGNPASIGSLNTGSAVSDGNGVARVVYTAPARTDFTANGIVQVIARPVSTDAGGIVYRAVRIEIRQPETKLFPQIPGFTLPLICDFVIEPPAGGSFSPGFQVLFQDTSSDPNKGGFLVRYHWDFGDGATADTPDTNHAYGFSGTFSVTHVVTDNAGLQGVCTKSVSVF